MDMAQAIILEKNLIDDSWPEIILVMTYIKNIYLIKALENNNILFNTLHIKDSNITYIYIFGSIRYVFFHKEEQLLKLEK